MGLLLRLFVLAVGFLAVPALAAANPERLLQEGLSLLKAGRTDEALAVLHDAARQLPDPARASGLLGEGYLQLGMQRLQGGDGPAAREAFAEAKRYLPEDFRPRQATAMAWLRDGQPAAAIGELEETLVLGGDRPELLILLGRAHYAAGNLGAAEEAWQSAAEHGAGTAVTELLDKVRRERQAERNMHRDLSGRFVLAYAPGISDRLAGEVLDALQDAYAEIGTDLGSYPEVDIPVLLYARKDFAAVTRSPEWAGAVYDGKIRVPLGGVEHMSPPLRALLHHEYAHVVVHFLGKGRVPVWLNEGFAEVVGRRQFSPPYEIPAPSGQRLAAAALERPFTELPAEQVPRAYAQSRDRVQRLIELCGWVTLGELLQRLGRAEGWESAVAAAYASCGYDWPRLQVELTDELH